MNSQRVNRRQFLALSATSGLAAGFGCRTGLRNEAAKRPGRLFFNSQGRTAAINADGTGLRYFDFNVPGQVTWQPGPFLSNGEICRLNPRTDAMTMLTHSTPPLWDFRASESSDGRFIVFCRAETGGVPAIWVLDADGRNPSLLTRGLEDQGADHPRWLPPFNRQLC